MTDREKIAKLEEVLDIEEGTLTAETILSNIPEYDSLARLSLLVMMDEDFGVQIPTEKIKSFITVNDVLLLMEKNDD